MVKILILLYFYFTGKAYYMLLSFNFIQSGLLFSFHNVLYTNNIVDVTLSPLFTLCSLWHYISYFFYSLTIIFVKFWVKVAINVLSILCLSFF